MEQYVTEVGKCALQVQVPEADPIKSVDDLTGKRAVTSFEVLEGQYLEDVDDRQNPQEGQRTRKEYVKGNVEAACPLGLADGIGAYTKRALENMVDAVWMATFVTSTKHPLAEAPKKFCDARGSNLRAVVTWPLDTVGRSATGSTCNILNTNNQNAKGGTASHHTRVSLSTLSTS